jgi:hypothetical protein
MVSGLQSSPMDTLHIFVLIVVVHVVVIFICVNDGDSSGDVFCHALVSRQAVSVRGSCPSRIKSFTTILSESDHASHSPGGRLSFQPQSSMCTSALTSIDPENFQSTTAQHSNIMEDATTQSGHPQGRVLPMQGDDHAGSAMTRHVEKMWGTRPNLSNFPLANFALGSVDQPDVPPILELPQFLSQAECRFIREWAQQAIEDGAPECDEYLNYRVNQEINQDGSTAEGKALIEEHLGQRDGGSSSPPPALTAENRGGFRIRLDDQLVERILKDRLLDVLDMPSRKLVFEEGAWIRPSPRTLVVRDQTVVFYSGGDGVPPHVDGKDGTLLLYLADVREDVGGRTVFSEDGFAQTPVEGTALLYRSKTELLHYSEAMKAGEEKWIMQLLLDYNHDFNVGDTVVDFSTGQSYVWDGTK